MLNYINIIDMKLTCNFHTNILRLMFWPRHHKRLGLNSNLIFFSSELNSKSVLAKLNICAKKVVNKQNSVFIYLQPDFPSKLIINRNSLNMVYFGGIFADNIKVFSKTWTNEHHFSNNTSCDQKQRCILQAYRQLAYTFTFAL